MRAARRSSSAASAFFGLVRIWCVKNNQFNFGKYLLCNFNSADRRVGWLAVGRFRVFRLGKDLLCKK